MNLKNDRKQEMKHEVSQKQAFVDVFQNRCS